MEEREDWHLTEGLTHEQGRGDPFAAAIRGTRMPMIITDPRKPDNPIVFANQAFQNLTGYSRGEVLGRNCRFLQGPETDREVVRAIGEAVLRDAAFSVDVLNYRKDGTTFWNALYISPVRSEEGEVQFFFASQLDVTERIDAQRRIAEQKAIVEEEVRARTAALERALEAKTTLLHEVDHRVKNNLTMIGALLRLQSRSIEDTKLSATLDNMLSRIDALAAVHRRLYESEDISRFEVGGFASGLVDDVIGSSGRTDIRIEKQVTDAYIRANQATALGLILNEVVTNAIKHAFADGREGLLSLRVADGDGTVSVTIADDGPGIGDWTAPPTSMGRTLVTRLSRQIGARTRWDPGNPGTVLTISLPSTGRPS